MAERPEDRIGQRLGNYRLVALLGQGGFAEVYLGQHVRLELQAAIKVPRTHLTGREAARFSQEAQTIARLTHPSIVRVFDYDVQEGVPFLVMDYTPHGSLRRRYPKGTVVPIPEILSYIKQIADALQYAHEQKVIHRDVKPENMLLGRREEVLLSDFGLAALEHSSASLTTQEAIGTLPYMAPEQIEGHPRAASDQYALGVVVYEWLCGSRPFEGSPTEVMVQQLSMPPLPFQERGVTIPLDVEQVVLRALAKDPKERFASVVGFAQALEQACRKDASGQTLPLPDSFPPLKTLDNPPINLPVQPTPLIGRKQEVELVCELLRRDEVRLVTLIGPGGIGKTRLGLQVAAELSESFAGGVFFVDLAALSNPLLVLSTITQTLSIQEAAGQSLLERLTEGLRHKQLLLLLDNFEQVVSAARQLADLLAACPRLKALVTSRERLHVRAEHEFAVPPLALPDPRQLADLAALSHSEAVALFLERAQASRPDFRLTAANARAIAEICIGLDGLPLAIELAAARIKLLPPQALLARLGQRLAVLTSRTRDVPARHQTLRHTIAWSYSLLSAQEQCLFRRLAVFVGGCTPQAVEAVSTAVGDADVNVLEGMASLLDKSLLQGAERDDGELRFAMLETIRAYGLEASASSGEMEITRRAHAAYYLRLVEEAEPELDGPQQATRLEQLERMHDNLRAALEWGLSQGQAEQGREMALRLGGALLQFWAMRGHYQEGRSFLAQALAGSEGAATRVRAKALIAAAQLTLDQGDQEQAQVLAEESLALCRQLADTRGIAFSLNLLGVIAGNKGNLAAVRSLNEEALTLSRGAGDQDSSAWSLYNLGVADSMQGEYARARTLLEESLALFRALGNTRGMTDVLSQLAWVLFVSQSDPTIVHPLLEEGLLLCREADHKGGIASYLNLSGQLALEEGDEARARALAEESLARHKELGHSSGVASSLALLARVEAQQGNYVAAHARYGESLAIARKLDLKEVIASDLEGLAGVVVQGEPVWAAQLWGAAEALRGTIGASIPPIERTTYERMTAVARAHLGENAFAAAWTEGHMMTPEQALAAQGPTMSSAPSHSTPQVKPPPTHPGGLTAREVEVLRLVAQGLTDAQIAEQLVISPRTVNTHLTSIYGKIQVSSRSGATRYAIEHHLI